MFVRKGGKAEALNGIVDSVKSLTSKKALEKTAFNAPTVR